MGARAKLIGKRLELYPSVYELISGLSKKLRRIEWGCGQECLSLGDLRKFQRAYDVLNSKVGVLFSSHAGNRSWQMREYICQVLIQHAEQGDCLALELEIRNTFGELIRELEVALKQDLGVFLDEFGRRRENLHFNNYRDLARRRNEG